MLDADPSQDSAKAHQNFPSIYYLVEKLPGMKLVSALKRLNIPIVNTEWIIQCLINQRYSSDDNMQSCRSEQRIH